MFIDGRIRCTSNVFHHSLFGHDDIVVNIFVDRFVSKEVGCLNRIPLALSVHPVFTLFTDGKRPWKFDETTIR